MYIFGSNKDIEEFREVLVCMECNSAIKKVILLFLYSNYKNLSLLKSKHSGRISMGSIEKELHQIF